MPLVPAAVAFLGVNAISVAWSIKARSTILFTVQLFELILVYPILLGDYPSLDREDPQEPPAVCRADECSGDRGDRCISVASELANHRHVSSRGQQERAREFHCRRGRARVRPLAQSEARPGSHLPAARGGDRTPRNPCYRVTGRHARRWRSNPRGQPAARQRTGSRAGSRRCVCAALRGGCRPAAGEEDNRLGSIQQLADPEPVLPRRSQVHREPPMLGTGARTYSDTLPGYRNDPDPNNLFLLTWAELGIPGFWHSDSCSSGSRHCSSARSGSQTTRRRSRWAQAG